MVKVLSPARIPELVGTKPKIIDEYVGRATTGNEAISIARMESPAGWSEPGQTPEFDEYTIVIYGAVHVETREGAVDVRGGSAVYAPRGEWVRYSTPEGAIYVAVCVPAFSNSTVHRDEK